MKKTLFAAALAALTALPAFAHDYRVGDLVIDHPWARETTPMARATGGFMTITNTGAEDDRLLAARSDAADMTQIHITVQDGDVMRMMEQTDGIVIPAGGSVEFRPGSYHVMFMGIAAPFVEGEERSATLVFERAGEVEILFAVEAMGGGEMHQHGDPSGHGMSN
ncbi:MAG: copper chaperone PCu(A)C [Rubricella sp.]